MWQSTLRYLDGVAHDVDSLAHPERLDPATRRLARLGSMFPKRAVARAVAGQQTVAARGQPDVGDRRRAAHTDGRATATAGRHDKGSGHDVVVCGTPTSPLGRPSNVVGQPAASIPAGFGAHHRPLSIQLCGPTAQRGHRAEPGHSNRSSPPIDAPASAKPHLAPPGTLTRPRTTRPAIDPAVPDAAARDYRTRISDTSARPFSAVRAAAANEQPRPEALAERSSLITVEWVAAALSHLADDTPHAAVVVIVEFDQPVLAVRWDRPRPVAPSPW